MYNFTRDGDFYSIKADKEKKKYIVQIEVLFPKTGYDHLFSEIEARLYEELVAENNCLFIGKIKKTNKIIYFFGTDAKKLEKQIQFALGGFPDYSYCYFVKNFDSVIKTLTPSMLEQALSRDLDSLAELGAEQYGKEAKVIFFVSYHNGPLQKYFLDAMENAGFSYLNSAKGVRKGYDGAYMFTKTICVKTAAIHRETETVVRISEEFRFYYEGWVLE